MIQGEDLQFETAGLARVPWSTVAPIRAVFREAFTLADLPFFNPHSFRRTLTQLGEQLCSTPEQFKTWSQNLGHESVMTTLVSYGSVPASRQAKVMRQLGQPKAPQRDVLSQIGRLISQAQR